MLVFLEPKLTLFPHTGTLKRRRAQQHASSQVQHQSQHPHGHSGHGGHGGQRQAQRQPQRQAQPQRHHRQPRENYQMGQMRRWDPAPSSPLLSPQCLGSSLCLQRETKASLHPKKRLTWLLVIIISSNYRQNKTREKEKTLFSNSIGSLWRGLDHQPFPLQCDLAKKFFPIVFSFFSLRSAKELRNHL